MGYVQHLFTFPTADLINQPTSCPGSLFQLLSVQRWQLLDFLCPADIKISQTGHKTSSVSAGQEKNIQQVFRFQLVSPVAGVQQRRPTPSSVTLRHACLPRPPSRTRCLQPTQRDVTCPYTQRRQGKKETLELELTRKREADRLVTKSTFGCLIKPQILQCSFPG